ncbi:hypothetical protein N2152v2_006193 [Parachlorella kessleri]
MTAVKHPKVFRGSSQKRGPKQKKKTKLPSIKNQIRGVQRLLAKEGLDAKVRQKQEERLKDLLLAKEQHDRAERERKYAKRYHKVRFFERVKIERHLHKLERQQKSKQQLSPEELAKLEQLREDLQYVLHFPKGEKYVSLLKEAPTPEEQQKLEAERARLRALARKQLAEAALVTEADEGRSLARKGASGASVGAAAAGGASGGGGGGPVEMDDELAGMGEEDDFFLHSSEEEELPEEAAQKLLLQQQQQQQQRQRRFPASGQQGRHQDQERPNPGSVHMPSNSDDREPARDSSSGASSGEEEGQGSEEEGGPGAVLLQPGSSEGDTEREREEGNAAAAVPARSRRQQQPQHRTPGGTASGFGSAAQSLQGLRRPVAERGPSQRLQQNARQQQQDNLRGRQSQHKQQQRPHKPSKLQHRSLEGTQAGRAREAGAAAVVEHAETRPSMQPVKQQQSPAQQQRGQRRQELPAGGKHAGAGKPQGGPRGKRARPEDKGEKQPVRLRAEGGRKRRRRNKE